jgi:uroporphyrinogen decarboxylase
MYSPERRDLVERAFRGEPIERPLVSLWRHWPEHDQDAEQLAAAHLGFQQRYDFDFAKFTPSGTDCVEDWGVETRFSGDPHGTRDVVRRGIAEPGDWERLAPLDFTRARLGRHLGALAALRRGLGALVPILLTAFSPLTVARKLAGDRIADDLRRHPEAFRRGLDRIADDTLRYVDLSLEAGADGLFFATQAATRDLLTDDEHRRWGVEYDRRLLEAAAKRTGLIVLHAHGSNLIWEQLLEYPVPALNWHDRAVGPSLRELKARFGGLLVGGVDEWGCLLEGPAASVRAQVDDAVAQAGDRNLCLAAGCVIGYRTPDRHIRAVRAAVKA